MSSPGSTDPAFASSSRRSSVSSIETPTSPDSSVDAFKAYTTILGPRRASWTPGLVWPATQAREAVITATLAQQQATATQTPAQKARKNSLTESLNRFLPDGDFAFKTMVL